MSRNETLVNLGCAGQAAARPDRGMLLCTDKNDAVVRYSLAGSQVPFAISSYELLPPDAREALPSEDQIIHALEA